MTVLSVLSSVASALNALVKGNKVTFTSVKELVSFLTILDDSKMSFTFGSLIYRKEVDGISKKSEQSGNIFKVVYAPIQTVTSYTKKILNLLAKNGKIITATELNVQKSYWAKRHTNSILGYKVSDETKTPTYLAYFPNGKPYNSKNIDLRDGKYKQKNDIEFTPSALKKYGSSTQTNQGISIEDQVAPRILKLENLREFTLNGIKIRLRINA